MWVEKSETQQTTPVDPPTAELSAGKPECTLQSPPETTPDTETSDFETYLQKILSPPPPTASADTPMTDLVASSPSSPLTQTFPILHPLPPITTPSFSLPPLPTLNLWLT